MTQSVFRLLPLFAFGLIGCTSNTTRQTAAHSPATPFGPGTSHSNVRNIADSKRRRPIGMRWPSSCRIIASACRSTKAHRPKPKNGVRSTHKPSAIPPRRRDLRDSAGFRHHAEPNHSFHPAMAPWRARFPVSPTICKTDCPRKGPTWKLVTMVPRRTFA